MSEQRLSVTFGAFSCDVIGYDDPFKILNRVVELFGEIARTNPGFGAGQVGMSDMERAQVAAGLATEASRIEEMADASATGGVRYVVTNEVGTNEVGTTEVGTTESAPQTDTQDIEALEDEVVVDAVPDDLGASGDLEVRDTLEGADAAATSDDLDLDNAIYDEDWDETGSYETGEDFVSDEDDPEEEWTPEDVAVESAAETADAPIPDDVTIDDPASDAPELEEAQVAARRPLRLQMMDIEAVANAPSAVDKAVENATETELARPESEQQEERGEDVTKDQSQKRKPRVTVTKLPLRPESEAKARKQALTPVQKVEPVVTLSSSITDEAIEASSPTRAERYQARMEELEGDDESDNFLFADVDEAVREAKVETEATRREEPLSLLKPLAPEPETAETAAPEAPAEKRPRRSLSNLLGFIKGGKDESAQDAPGVAADRHVDETHDNGFDRLRESVAAAMPATTEAKTQLSAPRTAPESISEAIDFDDETSPTAFARRVGATSLQDLLEASAVYMDLVEGKSRFSRRDVMQALHQIGIDKDYSQEARLKSFRKLLTTGSLVRVDDGMFTVSQATRFGYETQLQA